MKYVGDENGFSLVELMVSVAVFLSLMAGVFAFRSNMMEIYHHGVALSHLQQEASFVLDDILKDIREAETITIDSVEGGTNNRLTVFSSVIGTRTYWSVGDIPDVGHSPGELYKNEGGTDELILGDYNENGLAIRVADLTFTDDPTANLVTVSMQVQLTKVMPDSSVTTLETVSFTASAKPRNR